MINAKGGALKFPLIIIVAWLMVLVVRLIPVGGEWIGLNWFTWVVFLIWASVYFSAMFLGISCGVNGTINSTYLTTNWKNRWIRKLCFFSIFGAILISYEFAITRNYGFFTPVAVIRIMEVDAASAGFEGSWLSGAGRLLTPALMVAWVLAILDWSKLGRCTLAILFLASLIVFYQQMMFEGGRFYLAALLLMIFLTRGFVSQQGIKRQEMVKKRIFWIGLFIAVCLFFGYMFVNRYVEANRDFSDAYETWSENFDLEVNEGITSRLSGVMSGVWLAIYFLWAYATQGINELNSLLISSQPDLAWGAMQFPQIAQMLNKLTSSDLRYDQLQNLPNVGTYITIYGASYIDFGHVGALLFIGALGWLTGKAVRLLHSQRLNGLAINAPLLITLGVFSPIVSLMTNLWPAFCWALLVGSTVKLSTHRNFSKPTLA